MLRHLPSDTGAADSLPAVAPADGPSVCVAAMRDLCVAAAIDPARLHAHVAR